MLYILQVQHTLYIIPGTEYIYSICKYPIIWITRERMFHKTNMDTNYIHLIVFQPRNGWNAIYSAPRGRATKQRYPTDREDTLLVPLCAEGGT